MLSEYLAGTHVPREETLEMMEKGMDELVKEIVREWHGLRN
jgi:hypothetical protein